MYEEGVCWDLPLFTAGSDSDDFLRNSLNDYDTVCSSVYIDTADCRNLEDPFPTEYSLNMQSDNYSDLEGQLVMVSPNDISPFPSFGCLSSPRDPYVTSCNANETSQCPGTDSASICETDNFNHMLLSLMEQNSETFEENSINFFLNDFLNDENNSNDSTASQKHYHPDNDHCYSKMSETKDSPLMRRDFYGTRDLSDCSSEVDVVSVDVEVDEEFQPPVVPKMEVSPFRNTRQRKVQKSPRIKRNQSPLSAKTLNEAMKRNIKRITDVRRTNRRPINNSVETSPSNSIPSSATSSRCSSDVEDAGKRANHNSSERKRREVLRTNLQNLRSCVPAVQNNPKAPKVYILNSARQYISILERDEEDKVSVIKNEENRKKLLLRKLRKLKKRYQPCC